MATDANRQWSLSSRPTGAPSGEDFGLLGGPVTDAVGPQLNVRSRAAVSGQISLSDATERPTSPRKLSQLIQTRARIVGFLVSDYEDQ